MLCVPLAWGSFRLGVRAPIPPPLRPMGASRSCGSPGRPQMESGGVAVPGELVQEQREHQGVETAGEPSSPTDLIRSMALSSAELWHDVLQRLNEVQQGQRVLARAVAELGAMVQVSLAQSGAAPVLPAAATAELVGGLESGEESSESSVEPVEEEPEAAATQEERWSRRWRRPQHGETAEAEMAEDVLPELHAEPVEDVVVEDLVESAPVEDAVESEPVEDAVESEEAPAPKRRRRLRRRRHHRDAETTESSESAEAAETIEADVEPAAMAEIHVEDAAEAIEDVVEPQEAPAPKRRRGLRRRRHQRDAETIESPESTEAAESTEADVEPAAMAEIHVEDAAGAIEDVVEPEEAPAPKRRRGLRRRRHHRDAETIESPESTEAAETIESPESTEAAESTEADVEPAPMAEIHVEDAVGAIEDAVEPEEAPAPKRRRGLRRRRHQRDAETIESPESTEAADSTEADVEPAPMAEIHVEDAAGAIEDVVESEEAPAPKRRRGLRRRRHHRDAEVTESPGLSEGDDEPLADDELRSDPGDRQPLFIETVSQNGASGEPTEEVPVIEFAVALPPPPPLLPPPPVEPGAPAVTQPAAYGPAAARPVVYEPLAYERAGAGAEAHERSTAASAVTVLQAPQPIVFEPAGADPVPFVLDPPEDVATPEAAAQAEPMALVDPVIPQALVYTPSTAETAALVPEAAVELESEPVQVVTPEPSTSSEGADASEDRYFLRPARPDSDVVGLASEVLGTSLPPAEVDDEVGQPVEFVISEDVTLVSKRRRRLQFRLR